MVRRRRRSRPSATPTRPPKRQKTSFIPASYINELEIQKNTEVSVAKALAGNIENNVKFTNQASPELLGGAATVLQLAEKHPADLGEVRDKMVGQIAGIPSGFASAGTPDGGQALVDNARQMAANNPSRLNTMVGEGLVRGQQAGAELLKKDPFEYAHQNEWSLRKPIPLDPTNPQLLTQGMAERGALTATIGSHTGNMSISAIPPNELPQIKSLMTSGTLDQRTALVGAIANAGMPEPVLRATLGKLAESKETLPLAVAGSLVRDNPDAARTIIEGQAAMQAEPKYAPNKDDFPTELAKAIPYNDLPDSPAREGISGAVQAYYAKLSAAAGDTTGVLDNTRLSAAVTAVTGGVSSYRGSKVVSPWYGATQDDTDGAIRSLTDADFKGARTANGDPFPAAALKPSYSAAFTWNNWRLQSAGDGKYLVFSGPDDHRQYLGGDQGGKFVLDLGAKRSAVEQASAGHVSYIGSEAPIDPYSRAGVGGPY